MGTTSAHSGSSARRSDIVGDGEGGGGGGGETKRETKDNKIEEVHCLSRNPGPRKPLAYKSHGCLTVVGLDIYPSLIAFTGLLLLRGLFLHDKLLVTTWLMLGSLPL